MEAEQQFQETARQARRAAGSRWLDAAERLGYVVRGLLYGAMGVLALQVALGVGGQAVDQRGGLLFITRNPFGRASLVVCVVGLAAYALWGPVRAVFDPWNRGSDAGGLLQRLGYLWSGLSYAVLVVFGLQLLVGANRAGVSQDPVQGWVTELLSHPAGDWLTVAAGAIAVSGGLAQFIEAYRAGFRRDLRRARMSEAERDAADLVGRLGYLGRGITFVVLGWLLVQAGLHRDPDQAHGYGGAFLFLLAQPYGRLLLGFVSLCFVALGLHSLAYARWARTLANRW
ncbi:MAG TPA: DUF1206 domain-containing protein [Candidatus Dormibacteraeota bacterium]|nr:DUF1206 domain-containing protein [Candidatus Dormibacteraeota bacterium]